MSTFKKEIYNVCRECGVIANYITCLKRFGEDFNIKKFKRAFTVSTYHNDTCDICGEVKPCTETRDFFSPDFSLMKILLPFLKDIRLQERKKTLEEVSGILKDIDDALFSLTWVRGVDEIIRFKDLVEFSSVRELPSKQYEKIVEELSKLSTGEKE